MCLTYEAFCPGCQKQKAYDNDLQTTCEDCGSVLNYYSHATSSDISFSGITCSHCSTDLSYSDIEVDTFSGDKRCGLCGYPFDL